MVIVVMGILAAVAVPKMMEGSDFRTVAFHDETLAALRFAQKMAVSHRRLVCATLTTTTVSLSIASANPAAACNTAVTSPEGSSVFAQSQDANVAVMAAVVGPIYFQPTGQITDSGGGISDFSITIADQAPISLVGATGYVN